MRVRIPTPVGRTRNQIRSDNERLAPPSSTRPAVGKERRGEPGHYRAGPVFKCLYTASAAITAPLGPVFSRSDQNVRGQVGQDTVAVPEDQLDAYKHGRKSQESG